MATEEPGSLSFSTVDAERDYYKAQYEEIKDVLDLTKEDLESIKEQSETQEELITDLGADIDDLNARNEHLTRALEDSKIALQDEKRAWREEERRKEAEMAKLLTKIDTLEGERQKAMATVVTLEQGNDDLENHKRHAHSQLLDLQNTHNRLIEDKVILEGDLKQKEEELIQVQRLKQTNTEQSDEIANLEVKNSRLQASLEQALSSVSELERQIRMMTPKRESSTPQPVVVKSSSMMQLGTPSPQPFPSHKNNIMSPVEEGDSYEDSPGNASTRTIKPIRGDGIPPSPSKLPLLVAPRVSRLDSLRGRGSSKPGSPASPASPSSGLRRSNTLGDLSPSIKSSPSNISLSRTLNRSTNSRHLTELIDPDTPSRGKPLASLHDRDRSSDVNSPRSALPRDRRNTMLDRSGSSTNTTYKRPLDRSTISTVNYTPRKQSTGATSALASQKSMTSRTQSLLNRVTRLHGTNQGAGLDPRHEPPQKVIARKPSITSMKNAVNNFSSKLGTRVTSGAAPKNKGLFDIQQQEEADVTVVAGSPGGDWLHVRERTAEDDEDLSPTLMTSNAKSLRDRYLAESSSNKAASATKYDQNGMGSLASHSFASNATSKPFVSRPGIPSPMYDRRSISTSSSASTSHTRAPSQGSSHLSTMTSSSSSRIPELGRPVTPGLDSKSLVMPSRPSSRTGHRTSYLPRPSSRQGSELDRSQLRARSPVMPTSPATYNMNEITGLPSPPSHSGPTASIDVALRGQLRRTSAHIGLAHKTRVADVPEAATIVKSKIPRKSLPGRSASVVKIPEPPVPTLPVSRTGGYGPAGIGRGLPSSGTG